MTSLLEESLMLNIWKTGGSPKEAGREGLADQCEEVSVLHGTD